MRTELGGGYLVDDDPSVLDRDRLFTWLDRDTYWWPSGLDRTVFETGLSHSVCLSVLTSTDDFVGFGRWVTDRATFAYWADVYIDPCHRGRGLGGGLTRHAVQHPAVATCRRMMLATLDAHGVYKPVGFTALSTPEVFMEITRPGAGSPTR